jgi:phenylacetic acid degradation operon negative regulatory protein
VYDETRRPEPDRRQGKSLLGGSARSLLLTVLGELVVPDEKPVWTAALLYVLTGLGVSEQAARQAIARASDTGWIASERFGREVRWSFTPTVTEMLDDITRRVVSLNAPPAHWDGNGIFLFVNVPQEKKAARKPLYTALGWAGFGNPAPGLWTCPHVDRLDEAKAVIEGLGLRESTIVSIGRLADMGLTAPEIIAKAWTLDDVASRYAKLLDTYESMDPGPGDDLLFSYLSLVDEWRKFPAMDPQLPRDVLPDWIGRRAADTFVSLRTRWAPAARERWAEVVRFTAPSQGAPAWPTGRPAGSTPAGPSSSP